MAKTDNLNDFLTDVANSIRTKTQTTGPINAQDFSDKILSIQTGGGSSESTLKNLLDATTSAAYLFYQYKGSSIEGLISYDDTENVTNMQYMFRECTNIVSIPLLNTSKVTSASYMFNGCSNLTSLPLFDTSNVTSMAYLFSGCYLLTAIPTLNTSKVTNMTNLFSNCRSIISIPLLDTSEVTSMYSIFANCFSLSSVPLLNTSKVTSLGQAFINCSKLTEIPALDVSKVTSMSSIFDGCINLNAIHMTGMKVSFSISSSTKFTTESLHEIIDNLAIVTSTQTLTMGSTNLAKVSEEYKTIATNKGWTLA